MGHIKSRTGRERLMLLTALAVVTIVSVLIGAILTASAHAASRQLTQPAAGPGGSATRFRHLRVIDGGSGYDAWEILEPVGQTPPTAPLVVVMHGYFEFSGYSVEGGLARHVAEKGNIVIYPRWQTAIATPCPGPLSIQPCINSAVTAIHGAIAYLRARPALVQPRLNEVSYFGFSFGGIITANMLNHYKSLGLPQPRAVFLDDPADGGLAGPDEHALDSSLAGIPSTTKFVCHSGASGAITLQPGGPDHTSCNAVFPKVGQIPSANKSLVLTSNDYHGQPPLAAIHGVCAGPAHTTTTSSTAYPVDTFDWGFCWRSFDGLRACALYHADCQYALGNTPQNRYIGTWSDGEPVIGLKIQAAAPIRAIPVPGRQAKPRPPSNAAPVARITAVRNASAADNRLTLTGIATGDNGAQFVQIAIVRQTGGRCAQLTVQGRWIRLSRCGQPTSFRWANGDTRWSLTLSERLSKGFYRVYARAIDSLGQTQTTYPQSSKRTFSVA